MADKTTAEESGAPKRPPTPVYMQVFLGVIANLAVISPGMSLGFSAIALPTLTSHLNPAKISPDEASWVASVASIAMPIGCFLSGPILDRYGRKFALYSINVMMLIGWGIISLTDETNIETLYTQLLIGRFFAGIGTGLCSVPPTVLMSEISSPNLRGLLCTWTSVAFALGVQTIYILGYFLKENWKLAALISGIIPIFSILLIYCIVVESPVWLQNKGRFNEAEECLHKLQSLRPSVRRSFVPSIPAEPEHNKLLKDTEKKPTIIPAQDSGTVYNETCTRQETPSFAVKLSEKLKYFVQPECYKPFVIMVCYFFFQQFAGIFVIVYYAVDIVKEAGVEMDPYVAAIMIGSVRTIVAIFVGYISKRFGRRPPSIMSGAGMTICMVILAIYLYVAGPLPTPVLGTPAASTSLFSNLTNNTTAAGEMIDMLVPARNLTSPLSTSNQELFRDRFQWLPLLMLMLYFCTSTFGFLTIPFAMIGEVYPSKIRGFGGGLTACICYIFSFIVVKLYPTMLRGFGRPGLFMFYATMSLCGTIFVVLFLPETRGKTLQEIEDGFTKKRRSIIDETQQILESSSENEPANRKLKAQAI